MSNINTIVISPRRWGKSSLMKQVASVSKDPGVKFAFIDFFTIRTEEDFYIAYMREVLRSSINRKEEFLKAAREFFTRIIPVLTFSIDPQNDMNISLNWKEAQKSKDEIINLPEIIARKKGIRIVVCIDEFQQISRIKNYLSMEQELRSYWQHHQRVSYCLFGSRKHMMSEIFKTEARAFYRFGDMIMLDKIGEDHWMRFIKKSFRNSSKNINDKHIRTIINITDNHPDYIQQLCHHAWNLTENSVTEDLLKEAMDLVIRSNKVYYQNICENLSNTQYNLLVAIMNGEKQITSAKTMHDYHLGTPRNVIKNRNMLESKDILDIYHDGIHFTDPIFKYWLKYDY